MSDYIVAFIPIGIALVVYLIRIEGRLSKIKTDICWIKKEMEKCQQP